LALIGIAHARGLPAAIGRREPQRCWSASGASIDSQDTLAFSTLSGVRPMIETMPLARAVEAYARMMRRAQRFRMVLTMS
jgi:D-arabinose 1-dehydrogenase-like Zn-dependent alcohol dehydrogenase